MGSGASSEFRDLYIVPERVVAQTEDIVVTEIRMVTRDPATGRERRQGTVCEINHVRDGRIVSSRSYYMAEPEDDEEALSVPDRREATRIAEEQAALRRVATLVAEDVPAGTLFAAVAAEVGQLLGVRDARMVRYESDDTATIVASWGKLATALPVGTRVPLEGENAAALGSAKRSRRSDRRPHERHGGVRGPR